MRRIALPHVHTTMLGYGRLGVKLAAALENRGVSVFDHESLAGALPTTSREDYVRRVTARCKVVCWVSLPTHAYGWWEGQSPNVFTMFEATKLGPGFTEGLHNFDRIIVPSEQNVELFSQHHGNVFKVPLGVGPEWHPRPRPPLDDTFRFLTSGAGARKNPEAVAKAFRTVFPDPSKMHPRPVLMVKTPGGVGSLYGAPSVEQITGRISDDDELELYGMAHCYVTASKGEGFGLQPLQAITQGCPTILSAGHGHAEFSDFATYVIPTKLVPAEYFLFGDAGEWWESDQEALCEAMWDVYHNYDAAVMEAELPASLAFNRFTWDHTARAFMAAFGGELEDPDIPKTAPWYPIEIKRFEVKVIQRWEAELSDGRHLWMPDETYYEPADVKRLLFEAGVLHPDVLTGVDLGLSEAELLRLPHMRGRNAYCQACGQQLNTRPTIVDAYLNGEIPA